MMIALAVLSLLCAVIPAALFCINLRLYAEPPQAVTRLPAVSILIPARNEAHGIADAIMHALRSASVEVEVVVMDDASTDATAAIALALATRHANLRLERAPALPAGWNGKQHACWALAQTARYPILCFVDADVRLAPECIARMATFLQTPEERAPHLLPARGEERFEQEIIPFRSWSPTPGLVSGFPRQVTVTTLEWLLLPLIHFVLLGFLPIGRMRASTDPAFAAGCGQFLLCTRSAYFSTGGHSQIKQTMHDGLLLPRLFRQHGLRTDLADITDLATCRMYTSAAQVWNGLAKNATEGIAAPARIGPITLVLLLGQVLPFLLLTLLCLIVISLVLLRHALGIDFHATNPLTGGIILVTFVIAAVVAWLPRILATRRFRQDWRSAVLHPIGILLLLAVQWYALIRQFTGRAVSWKDRAYPSG